MKTFAFLFALSLLAGASTAKAANFAAQPESKHHRDFNRTASLSGPAASSPEDVSFTGTWKTISGGTHLYTVILKQIDNEVTGSYSPGNGKIFDGVVTDRKLTFKWTQDGGYEGTAEFIMDEDGKGFTGSSTALKPKEFTSTWNTYKPPVASFAGSWETISNGQYAIQLTVVQTGNKVTGIYPSNNGKIEGTVSGRVLRFKWESDGGSGSGRFVLDETERAFSGTYNRGENPDEVEATWNGKRPEKPSGFKAPPVSFSGVWKVVSGGIPVTMKIRQNGDQVVLGVYATDTPDAPVKLVMEGTVVANTLRFKILDPKGALVDAGEFAMDESGKSFKGIARGLETTGTFVRSAP